MANGVAPPCFAVDLEQTMGKHQLDETSKVFVFGALVEAGSDTSRTAIGQFLTAAALDPHVVEKAGGCLDEACGHDAERLPAFQDRDALAYIKAVVEVLRWRVFIMTGLPRMLIKDDEYERYRFPAGTVFMWNAYGIALSGVDYDNPLDFVPERFLNVELNQALKGQWAFGVGKLKALFINARFM